MCLAFPLDCAVMAYGGFTQEGCVKKRGGKVLDEEFMPALGRVLRNIFK